MTDWNRAYLDAMGVPIWTPRDLHSDGVVEDLPQPSDSSKEFISSQTQASPVVIQVTSVIGNNAASHLLVISDKLNLQQASKDFQQLQNAWLQWTGTQLPMALVQVSEQGQSLQEFKQAVVVADSELLAMVSQSESVEHLQSPALSLAEPQSKKAWWQFFQELAVKVSN